MDTETDDRTTITRSGFPWEDVAWRFLAYSRDDAGEIEFYAFDPTPEGAAEKLAEVMA